MIPEDVMVWWERTVGEGLDEGSRAEFLARPEVRTLAADFSLNTLRGTAASIFSETGHVDVAVWLALATAVHRDSVSRHGRDESASQPDADQHRRHSALLRDRPEYP